MDYTGTFKKELKSLPQYQKATLDLIISMNTLAHLTTIVHTCASLNNEREAKMVLRGYLPPKSTLRKLEEPRFIKGTQLVFQKHKPEKSFPKLLFVNIPFNLNTVVLTDKMFILKNLVSPAILGKLAPEEIIEL